jgi:hypothetical protein
MKNMVKGVVGVFMLIGLVFVGGCVFDRGEKVDETNLEETSVDDSVDTSDWLTYENEEYGFSFEYPKNWHIKEDVINNRIYIRNVKNDVNKETMPSNFQQLWFSILDKNVFVEKEKNIKNDRPDGREIFTSVLATTIDTGEVIINIYEYETVGGLTLQAFWSDKFGNNYYATNSTEVGEENQKNMVENLKKILSTILYF